MCRELNYGTIYDILHNSSATLTSRQWDEVLGAPYFNYRGADNTVHQMWYDDPESLILK